MPRQGAAFQSDIDDVLRRRITYERERRDWTYAVLARHMEAAGHPLGDAALWKIEKGDPPRRVSASEMVALARVFELPLEAMIEKRGLHLREHALSLVSTLRRSPLRDFMTWDRMLGALADLKLLAELLPAISDELAQELGRMNRSINLRPARPFHAVFPRPGSRAARRLIAGPPAAGTRDRRD